MDIRTINWGSDSAEADANLLKYFITPSKFQLLQSFQKDFVVGRKGAGKSAIRRKLLSYFNSIPDYLAIESLPNQTVFRSIKNDSEIKDKFGEEVFFQYAWLSHLMHKSFSSIGSLQEGKFLKGSIAEARKYAEQIGATNPDFLESVRSLLEKTKLKAGTLGELGIELDKTLKNACGIDSVEYHLKKLADDNLKIIFMIDDLDLGWDNSIISNKILQGLLLASQYLKAAHKNFKVFIFIRDDMYRLLMLETQHSDKYRDVVRIKWDNNSLKNILEERIKFNFPVKYTAEDCFHTVFPETIGNHSSMNWLIERTLNRPRELIQLSKLYTENLTDNAPNADVIKGVEEQYSKIKLEDLCAEYSNQYQDLKNIFDFWKARLNKTKHTLDSKEFDQLLLVILSECSCERDWFKTLQRNTDTNGLKAIFFEIGFIGDYIRGGQGGSKTTYSEEGFQPVFQDLQIHPCFRKAIGTVERIRS